MLHNCLRYPFNARGLLSYWRPPLRVKGNLASQSPGSQLYTARPISTVLFINSYRESQKPSGERFRFANRQSKQSHHSSVNKPPEPPSRSHDTELPSPEDSKISSIDSVSPQIKTESFSDIAPQESKGGKSRLGSAIETIAAQPTVQSSSASLPNCNIDKVSRKRKHEREASDVSTAPKVSSSDHKKRKKIASQSSSSTTISAAKSRYGEPLRGAEMTQSSDLAALTPSPLLGHSKEKKRKEKSNNGTQFDVPITSTSYPPQQVAVESKVSDTADLPVPVANNGEEAFSKPRRKKRKPVPHLNVLDMKTPEAPVMPDPSTSGKEEPSSGDKRKRCSPESDLSTSPSERKKLKQSKKSFPKVGSSKAGPSRQDKGKGKEVVTSPKVWTDSSCAEPFEVVDSLPDNDFSDLMDELSTLSSKAARERQAESTFSVNPSRFRSQTMPPTSSFKSTRPNIRDNLVLDRGDFMGSYIKEVVTQSFDELQISSQSTASAGVTSGPPPSLASANHHEILRYYGARREQFTEDQLVEIVRNPMLSGLKRNKVAEHAFSTNGSVKAPYRHLQARLTEAEWAKVAPKQKRHKDRDRVGWIEWEDGHDGSRGDMGGNLQFEIAKVLRYLILPFFVVWSHCASTWQEIVLLSSPSGSASLR